MVPIRPGKALSPPFVRPRVNSQKYLNSHSSYEKRHCYANKKKRSASLLSETLQNKIHACIFSENLGLKPPFVSPCLDFPNQSVCLLHTVCFGHHVCRTKLPPIFYRYEKWFEKSEKGYEKRSETSRRLNISHRHFSKSFSPPKN